MKSILIFLFACGYACAQEAIYKSDTLKVTGIYKAMKYAELCKDELNDCQGQMEVLKGLIIAREDKLKEQNDSLRTLDDEISGLRDALEQKRIEEVKIKERQKRFGVGVSAGVDVYGKPCLNVGLNWSVFRF
jgi:hypothetical protein